MKQAYLTLFTFVFFSCIDGNSDELKFEKIDSKNSEILEIFSSDLNGIGKTETYSIPVILPLPLASQNSSIVIFDFADKQLKQFLPGGIYQSFNPLEEGPNRLGGSFFKGVGYLDGRTDSVLISSNTMVKSYDLTTKTIGSISYDNFDTCPSFNNSFSQIFSFGTPEDGIIITQNGSPCYDLNELFSSVTLDNFSEKFYARIKSMKSGEVKYSLQLPKLPMDNLYERFRLYLTYSPSNDRFYAMLNPMTYLFEFKFDKKNLEFELLNTWDLEMRFSALPVDYFIEEKHNTQASNLSLDYNFEINFIDSFQDQLFISYLPSKELAYENVDDAPFSSHNLLAIVDLKDKNIKTYAFNYYEIQFFGATSDGIWLYDVRTSEQGGKSIFKIIPHSSIELLR
ncbi:hypothetical protein [Algoriphagus sediminis]|uniref:DUF4221 domain-containing protein n=1 Tax=Algoriphagus sediminis TaxID=3057113 RepID=A0ABT7YFZ9_9BACT|nr:hypothetical protein [Algoriphagus sediminis]MDN3205464.1 hypothetical protein [Algoriphagus sediminis]